MPVGWAVLGSAVIGAVGSNMAADKQASGQQAAAATQQHMFDTITKQEQPFLQGGYGAETQLNKLMAPGGYLMQQFNPTQAQLNNYPGYQWQKQQGQLATESAATPGVGAISGPGLKSLMNYNQGLAASNYGNYFNQFQTQQNNIFNRLNSIASLGQNAAGNLGNAGTQLGQGIASAQAGAAASQAGGIVGTTNSLSSGANSLGYLMSGNQGGINSDYSGAFSANGGGTAGSSYDYMYGS